MSFFDIQSRLPNGRGRAGVIHTPHGDVHTPAFIPVGTKATVKSLSPEQVRLLGADAVLANTYHLYLQPGTDILEKAGGLGKFMDWPGPTFTDSGGFQAFSLGAAFGKGGSKIAERGAKAMTNKEGKEAASENGPTEAVAAMAKITEDGVSFKSVIDGSSHFFTPERSIEIQRAIGADIIFAFDECTSPHASYEYQREAMERTHRWAARCLDRHRALKVESAKSTPSGAGLKAEQALFGIVQGGRHEDLRTESARTIGKMDFDGFGIGGSFDKDDIATAVGWVVDELPEGKPRHLLGIGEPEDLILGIENGIDTFDCVAPTRMARNGTLYSRTGRINITNAAYREDITPIEAGCDCYACASYSRAYIHHLFKAKEMFAATLASIHNLHFLIRMARDARQAIIDGTWEAFKAERL